MGSPVKLLPRNVAALRRSSSASTPSVLASPVTGNPVSTLLESGVGNCFPGLECDLRNLERRFFPFLEVDLLGDRINVVSVDKDGVGVAQNAGALDAASASTYGAIASDLEQSRHWTITALQGTFGPLGQRTLKIADLNATNSNGNPPDVWTAVRLLTEGTPVTVTLKRGATSRTLTGPRQRYLDDKGALAGMFVPGELTQSLCSPWTHDFRDCACFYWASNHPDIARPPEPAVGATAPEWNADVPWERAARVADVLPQPATVDLPDSELDHYEINARWQELNFVLEGRENLGPYLAQVRTASPFDNAQQLMAQLRYASGVELAVMQTYLTAAFSLRTDAPVGTLRDDITAARAELMRIAIGEMQHLRAVNGVIASMSQRAQQAFEPALHVARVLPGQGSTPWTPSAATPEAIVGYLALEAPSQSIDGLYARILATLARDGTNEDQQTVRTVMAEGEDHFETFEFIQEWLGRHAVADYLVSPNLAAPPADNAAHAALQTLYVQTLGQLHSGYTQGLPAGAAEINEARSAMIAEPGGLLPAMQAVAGAGFLVVFDAIGDARFTPMDPP
ncbi:ferritin-like domain-containing protein [Paraburkholderia nodosa]|uniref:ferritin-like domain-containing protein n=1 Tax=Paraburkholderia nodosa TaxID=392320 RepID=UPI0008414028|nr:ferritin-like domain-containing protein [Paraburkholderia nodosa]